MPKGRKCQPSKTLYNLTATLLLLGVAAFSQGRQHPAQPVSQTNLPLKNCWNFSPAKIDGSQIASDNDQVYLPLDDGKLIALDARTGLLVWQTEFGGQSKNTLYAFNDDLFVISEVKFGSAANTAKTGDKNTAGFTENYIIRRLDKRTGIVFWQQKIPEKIPEKTPDGGDRSDTRFYLYLTADKLFAATSGGDFYTFDALDGKLEGMTFLRSEISAPPFFKGEQVFFGAADKRILSLSLNDSSKIFERRILTRPTTIVVIGNNLVWGDAQGGVTSERILLKSRRKNWELRTGGEILNVTAVKENLLIASLDNYIYSVEEKSGKILWKKRLSNRPAFTALIIDGTAVLTTVGDSTAVIAEIESGRTINKINFGDNVFFSGSPQNLPSIIIFPTTAGIFAVTTGKNCE